MTFPSLFTAGAAFNIIISLLSYLLKYDKDFTVTPPPEAAITLFYIFFSY